MQPLPSAQGFLDRVTVDDDEAVEWRPKGQESPVIIDADTRFGRLSVGGISACVLMECSDDGYEIDKIATELGLDVREVRLAIAYELEARPA